MIRKCAASRMYNFQISRNRGRRVEKRLSAKQLRAVVTSSLWFPHSISALAVTT